jgi:hypothetical protein
MGTYYIAINQSKREWLDPSQVGHGNEKYAGVTRGPFAMLLGFMMATEWKGDAVAVVADEHPSDGDQWFDARRQFRDVTRAAVEAFNEGLDDGATDPLRIAYRERDS